MIKNSHTIAVRLTSRASEHAITDWIFDLIVAVAVT
jgi:hypothetical protein